MKKKKTKERKFVPGATGPKAPTPRLRRIKSVEMGLLAPIKREQGSPPTAETSETGTAAKRGKSKRTKPDPDAFNSSGLAERGPSSKINGSSGLPWGGVVYLRGKDHGWKPKKHLGKLKMVGKKQAGEIAV